MNPTLSQNTMALSTKQTLWSSLKVIQIVKNYKFKKIANSKFNFLSISIHPICSYQGLLSAVEFGGGLCDQDLTLHKGNIDNVSG